MHQRAGCQYCGLVLSLAILYAMAYLTFTALQGEHGLFRLLQLEEEEESQRRVLSDLREERRLLENNVHRLSLDGIDLDLLDERARKVLAMGRPNELLIP